jgi:hypothetical protein
MNNTGNTIRDSLKKRQEAILKHIERKKAFLERKEQMLKEMQEARLIWKNLMDQLPHTEF